jgi:hypothetical protein
LKRLKLIQNNTIEQGLHNSQTIEKIN